jgi:nitroreductase
MELRDKREFNFDIHPFIAERRSLRSYSDTPIDEEVLLSLFEAARWAPSSNNDQPWNFIIARKKEDLMKFHRFIDQSNLEWCKRAPVLALLVASKKSDKGYVNPAYLFDSGTAFGFLALEATRRGINICPIGGFEPAIAKEILNIPDDFQPWLVISLGYPGDKDLLPQRIREKEEKTTPRKELNEFLFEGSWDEGTGPLTRD